MHNYFISVDGGQSQSCEDTTVTTSITYGALTIKPGEVNILNLLLPNVVIFSFICPRGLTAHSRNPECDSLKRVLWIVYWLQKGKHTFNYYIFSNKVNDNIVVTLMLLVCILTFCQLFWGAYSDTDMVIHPVYCRGSAAIADQKHWIKKVMEHNGTTSNLL